jgi:hypothetical protein
MNPSRDIDMYSTVEDMVALPGVVRDRRLPAPL